MYIMIYMCPIKKSDHITPTSLKQQKKVWHGYKSSMLAKLWMTRLVSERGDENELDRDANTQATSLYFLFFWHKLTMLHF